MKREFPSSPILGVGAIIVHQGRVLLARRANAPMKGRWTLPGGAVELGETAAEAIVREIEEETGLLVTPVALVEVVNRIDRRGGKIRFHYVIVDFLCTVAGGSPSAGTDVSAVQWLKPSEWRSGALSLDPVTLRVLEKAWRMKRQLPPTRNVKRPK